MQIVDARNPLTFRSEDLEKYVLELNGPDDGSDEEGGDDKGEGSSKKPKPKRQNLLLINKSDLLTRSQRCVSTERLPPSSGGGADVMTRLAGSAGPTTLTPTAFSTPSSLRPTASRCRRSARGKRSSPHSPSSRRRTTRRRTTWRRA